MSIRCARDAGVSEGAPGPPGLLGSGPTAQANRTRLRPQVQEQQTGAGALDPLERVLRHIHSEGEQSALPPCVLTAARGDFEGNFTLRLRAAPGGQWVPCRSEAPAGLLRSGQAGRRRCGAPSGVLLWDKQLQIAPRARPTMITDHPQTPHGDRCRLPPGTRT